MTERLLGFDPVTGLAEFHRYDEGERKTVIRTSQDVAPVLEDNTALRNDRDGYSPSRELRRVAAIPAVAIEIWRREYGLDLYNRNHWPGIKRLLNDPDWLKLRTASGRI